MTPLSTYARRCVWGGLTALVTGLLAGFLTT